jgi:hypothetical protein
MDDWLSRFAAALGEGVPADAPAIDLGPEGEELVLELGRIVREQSGDVHVPLASFLTGLYVALRATRKTDPARALEEAVRVARRMTPNRTT